MKGMFLKKFDIYYQKCATVAQRFQLSMTKLGACDEIRWNDGTRLGNCIPYKACFIQMNTQQN